MERLNYSFIFLIDTYHVGNQAESVATNLEKFLDEKSF